MGSNGFSLLTTRRSLCEATASSAKLAFSAGARN